MAPAFCLRWKAQRGAGTGKPVEGDLGAAGTPDAGVKGFKEGNQFDTLLGVTGSGKTFTMANVIQALNKPTLIISHNKTLAGQLYGEMKEFFPENAVEYFVSYNGT